MSNPAMTLEEDNAEVQLSAGQLEGLGKVGDTANQIAELLKMAQAALESMRDSIDIDAMADRVGPEVEALVHTLGELMNFLGIDSAEALQRSVHENLQAMESAQVREAAPELINLLGALHSSGLLKVLPPLLAQIGSLTSSIDPEALAERMQSLNENLRYWTATAREGVRIVGDRVKDLDLPERVAVLEDMADQWWRIAIRAKHLAQGDAESLGDRVEWLVGQAEHWGGQIGIAVGTLRDMAPEVVEDLDLGTIGAKVAAGALEWLDIAWQANDVVKGDAETLTVRVRAILAGIRHAGLEQVGPEMVAFFATVNRTGMFRKVNMVLAAVEPHIPEDERFKAWLDETSDLLRVYQPQIQGAIPALHGAMQAMEGKEKKGGGLFGLLGIVFSRKTQYVLRFAIEFAYRFLRGNKA
ncbi:MAG: hypothetical protein P8Y78_12065 [Acidihalobacter sp.]